MDKKDNFENTFDHQDWKQVIVRKKKTKEELNTNPKPSQASQKAKSIELKAAMNNLTSILKNILILLKKCKLV